ncbi:MAG: hypothetical protein AB4038_20180 [Prochloraceae cyanobacterium]
MDKKTICLDFGSTGIKQLDGSRSEQKVNYKLVEPEYLCLPSSSVPRLPKTPGMGKSIDSAWVQLKKKGDCHLIGFTAKDYQARFNFKEPKINSIVPKTLGILGSLYEENSFGDYRLGLLVPLNELSGAGELSANLVKSLKRFYLRSRKIELPISAEEIFIVPEGTGAAMRDHKKGQHFQNSVCAYLMIGYNHAALNVFKQGRFVQSNSQIERLGAVRLTELMQRQVPGLEKDAINRAISTKINSKASYTGSYTTADWSQITSDVEALQLLYQQSLEEYWRMLKSWLSSCIGVGELDYVVRCGGTSDLLADQLRGWFQDLKISLYIPNDYKDKMLIALGLNQKDTQLAKKFIELNPIRFADVWGLFVALSGYSVEGQAAPKSEVNLTGQSIR